MVLDGEVDLVEHVQLLDDLLQALVLIPYEIETQMGGLFVLYVYIKVMIGSNVLGDAVECDVVEDTGSLTPSPSPRERGVITFFTG